MGRWSGRWIKNLALCAVLGLSACGASETLILLPDDSGKVGALAILSKDGSGKAIIMDKANQMTRVDAGGAKVTTAASAAEVSKEFGPALASLPAPSMHFTLYFEMASTRVAPDSQAVMVKLFAEVARRQAVEVLVTGHTDTVGYQKDNDKLAMKRAVRVRKMLMDRGLKASFIWAAGRGERELLIQTPQETPEARNRRVEVIVR